MELPQFQSYGNYSSDNYGNHTLQFFLPGITIYYSYKTIVAYSDNQDGLVVCENVWGTTTGKHLDWINDDKKSRIKSDKFDTMLKAALERHFVTERD